MKARGTQFGVYQALSTRNRGEVIKLRFLLIGLAPYPAEGGGGWTERDRAHFRIFEMIEPQVECRLIQAQRPAAFGAALNSLTVIVLTVQPSWSRTRPPCSGTVLR